MKAVEVIHHALSLAIRPTDHFSGRAWPAPITVALDSQEPAVPVASGAAVRHADGSYRFIAVTPGLRTITVTPGSGAFTWTPTTTVNLATHDRRNAVAIEVWPGPTATFAAGTLVLRGRLVGAVAAGLEVRIEVTGAPARNRRTRVTATGEFVFPVLGMVALTADRRVELDVAVPTRTVTSIQILDGATNPVTPGHRVQVWPGRETRARITLT